MFCRSRQTNRGSYCRPPLAATGGFVCDHRQEVDLSVTGTVTHIKGDLPDELTAEFTSRIEVEGQPPVALKDTFSGMSVGRARLTLTAEIDAVELDSDTYSPGDTVKANVFLKPYKGTRTRQTLALKLPADLPEGS